MPVKYIKSSHIEPLTEGVMSKMRLNVNGEDVERIWVKRFNDYCVLQNHALNLMPFESWGVIIPSVDDEFNLNDILAEGQLELHPEAWMDYIKAEIITEEGEYIKTLKRSHEQPNE